MNELEVLINLRGRIRRRNGLSKDGSEERTLTLNQLDALDFALNRIEKLDRLEKWLNKEICECYNYPNIIDFPNKIAKFGFKEREEVLKEVREVFDV